MLGCMKMMSFRCGAKGSWGWELPNIHPPPFKKFLGCWNLMFSAIWNGFAKCSRIDIFRIHFVWTSFLNIPYMYFDKSFIHHLLILIHWIRNFPEVKQVIINILWRIPLKFNNFWNIKFTLASKTSHLFLNCYDHEFNKNQNYVDENSSNLEIHDNFV